MQFRKQQVDIYLFLFRTSQLLHVQFYLLLPELYTGFSREWRGLAGVPGITGPASCVWWWHPHFPGGR